MPTRVSDPTEVGPRWDIALLLVAVVVGYPLAATLPMALWVDSRVVTVPYRALVLVLSCSAIWRSWTRGVFYVGVLWTPLLGFWLLYVGRMLLDAFIAPVPLNHPPGEYLLYGIGTCLVPMLALLTLPSDGTLRLGARLITGLGALAAIAAIYFGLQALLSGDLRSALVGRFEVWTINSITLGHLGATVASLALFQLLFRAKLATSVPAVVALIAAAALGLLCVGIAASKGPLIALACNVAILLFMLWRLGRRVHAVIGAFLAPALGYPAAVFVEKTLGFGIISRLEGAVSGSETGSVDVRLELMQRAGLQFLDHPLLGSGLEEKVLRAYPHNVIIEAFMAVGIVGGVAFVVFQVAALYQIVRLMRVRPEAAWVGMLAVQYSVAAMFSGSLYLVESMWGMLAATIAAAAATGSSEGRPFAAAPSELPRHFPVQP